MAGRFTLALCLAVTFPAALHAQASPADHAAHHIFVLPTFTYFPVSDAREESQFISSVELTPIPSPWGHVAGGGGDEGAKPFNNEKVAAFLKRSAP